MMDTLSGPELRRYAMRCRAQADNPACSEEERRRLLDMHSSFLSLAETADWLAGKSARGEVHARPSQANTKQANEPPLNTRDRIAG